MRPTLSALAALGTRATLRWHVQRCQLLGDTLKRLFTPTRAKAVIFRDDILLPYPSNMVKRGDRRYRTRPKHVCQVSTHERISARMALDMWREAQGEGRQ